MQKLKNFSVGIMLAAISFALVIGFIMVKNEHQAQTTTSEKVMELPDAPSHIIDSPVSVREPESERPSLIIELPPLDKFVDAVFDECGGKQMSPALRSVRKAQLLRFVDQYLTGMGKYDYIAIPCNETAMGSVKRQVSTAGALGFAQLMPATAKAEAKLLGLGDLNNNDLQDVELNLTLSVQHYSRLIKEVGPELAAAAYNGGPAAASVKDLAALRPARNAETAGYVSVAYVIMRKHMKEVLQDAKDTRKTVSDASH